jgi:hypothetical protein
MEIEDYINDVLKSFEDDPADTDYQEGYAAAYRELQALYFPNYQ